MSEYSENEKLDLFKSLFKGREDVFALYWQKGNKKGYMPAYNFDPYMYRLHKNNGGTFKNYKDKSFQSLTNQQLIKHLNGEQLIGLYPLLQDNTSWFIAADFDKENWPTESLKLQNICTELKIPAYREKSRSGKGAHVWIFFDAPYPAVKSRKILISLLEQTNIFSVFDKYTSFDRLFPNQDYHSGKGLGNLIALPFNKKALEEGNCCFINSEHSPYSNQWEFLRTIKRTPALILDSIFDTLSTKKATIPSGAGSNVLHIKLENFIFLNKQVIQPELINLLKEELNFSNSDFFIKKNAGKSTRATPRYFKLLEENENEIFIPRGFIGKLLRFCKKQNIKYHLEDLRSKKAPREFSFNIVLRPHQKKAMDIISKKDFGVISAPPGSGKTIIGLKTIAEKQQPALIIVHRKQLLEQWIDRIQDFLGIPKKEIGKVGQGKASIGKSITIAMIQSLKKYLEKQNAENFPTLFGTIIIDECHHIPAESYRMVLSKFSSYYQYGLTATPFRKGNDDKLIFNYIGEKIVNVQPKEIENFNPGRIIIRETDFCIPFNPKTDPFETLSKILIHDSARNKLILTDITQELLKGNKAVIITERKEHIHTIHQFLKQSFEIIKLSGDDSDNDRKAKWNQLRNGDYQALITTGQLFGEGTDLQNASCLFLVYPFSFKGKLIQYLGRVQRSETSPVIYDYRDRKIDYLNKLFLKRNSHYRALEKEHALVYGIEELTNINQKTFSINLNIKRTMDNLQFQYGSIAFSYEIPDYKLNLDFAIENDEVRPEFEVLKPYFSRVIGKKEVEINILAEIEMGQIIAQTASSVDLEKINQKMVEIVKFDFITQGFFYEKENTPSKNNLFDLGDLKENKTPTPLFDSEESLLFELLKNKNVKHYKQLKHLAANHEYTILNIKFVINPFSFVFLLSGLKQYHFVLETLETEEATYIWHFEKIEQNIPEMLDTINADLNLIKKNGRHEFLKNTPKNFNRIFHNYTDEMKGFVTWKDQLEEKLW